MARPKNQTQDETSEEVVNAQVSEKPHPYKKYDKVRVTAKDVTGNDTDVTRKWELHAIDIISTVSTEPRSADSLNQQAHNSLIYYAPAGEMPVGSKITIERR